MYKFRLFWEQLLSNMHRYPQYVDKQPPAYAVTTSFIQNTACCRAAFSCGHFLLTPQDTGTVQKQACIFGEKLIGKPVVQQKKLWYNNCKSSYYTKFIAIFLPGFAGNRKIWLYYTIPLTLHGIITAKAVIIPIYRHFPPRLCREPENMAKLYHSAYASWYNIKNKEKRWNSDLF